MTDQTVLPAWQEGRGKLAAEIRNIVVDESGAAFRDFLHRAHDRLIEFAGNTCAGHELADLHRARSRISTDHNQIVRIFVRRLGSCYDRQLSTAKAMAGDAAGRPGGTTLSLVEDEELEEHVALSSIQKKAETELSSLLWALCQRFALLQGSDEVPVGSLPMTPASYCAALQEAFSPIHLSLASRLYLYKLFDRWYLPQLKGLYERINGLMKNRGLLPDLRLQLQKRASDRYSDIPSRGSAEGSRQVDDRYEQLLNDIGEQQGRLHSERPAPSPYSVGQLLHLNRARIDSLVAGAENLPLQDIRADNEQLKFRLQQVLGAETLPQLNTGDMKTIDLVGMLFEYMLNDDQLPDCVKATLSFLHTPYLKIAFADTDFFRQHQHPARQLLNVLADAGVRWVANDGSSEFKVYQQMQETVRRILQEFDNEVKLFASLLMEFNSYIRKVELRVQLMERRAMEKARGEDRLREAKRRVNTEILQRTRERKLPSPILLFLLQPWTDYMVFVLLRSGDQSESWHQALSLVEDLLWGLDITGESDELVRWRQHYPWLEATMQKGFELVGYDRGRAARLKLAIDKVYNQLARNLVLKEPNAELHQKLVRLAEHRMRELPADTLPEAREQELVEQLCIMDFGTWFEFADGRREKVAWFNASSRQFLFVDQGGKRTGIRSGEEIARAVIAGQMRMIVSNAKPLVERTLESIYSDLNDQARSHAGT